MKEAAMADDPARGRFLVIGLTRLGGAGLVLLGLAATYGRLGAVPREAGVAMTLVGVLAFAVVPILLARRWRTPRP
jgi:hypothetical protein